MKSRAEQLDEMSEAILLATDRIRYYKQQDKMLQSEIKRLTRNERTHRLCTRGGMIEAFIKSFPGDCTNSTLFCAMFRIVVFCILLVMNWDRFSLQGPFSAKPC